MYKYFSRYYDTIMEDVDYRRWAWYICDLIESSGVSAESVLEIGCGTGNVLFELEATGKFKKLIGLDLSQEMISIASEKAVNSGSSCRFLVSDMKEFAFTQKFDLVICLFDSLNYLTEVDELKKAVMNVYFTLNDRKLFIFDSILMPKIRSMFSSGSCGADLGNIAYIWELECLELNRIYNIRSTFFERKKGNEFKKYIENHSKRIFSVEELHDIMIEMDFYVQGVYDAYKFQQPADKTERVYFLCRKGGF